MMDENPNLPEEILDENPNLPEEILIEIFSRLPAKSAGRCRLLAKTWRTQLSTSQFVNLHLLNRRINPENLLLIGLAGESLRIIDSPIVDNTVSRKLDLEVSWKEVVGCCNGLVLLLNLKFELFLVNPITLHHFKLPPLPYVIDKSILRMDICGLGYDSSSDDYKVLALTYTYHGGGVRDRFIHLYSVKSGAWKRVDDSDDGSRRFYGSNFGVYLNGAIHAYSRKYSPGVIEAFDLADCVFREFPAPPCKGGGFDDLLLLGGCLCMSKTLDSGDIEIWMMKQYGLPDSWTKFTTVRGDGKWDIRQLVCFMGDRDLVMLIDGDKLLVHNLDDGTTKDMVVDGVPASFCDGVPIVDSLVSPNHQYSNLREER